MGEDWEDWDEIDELEMEADEAQGFHDDRFLHDGSEEDTDEGGWQVSAWDVGTGFALAGWLLDRQTDRIVDELRASSATRPPRSAEPVAGRPAAAAPIDWEAAALQPVTILERDRLAVTLALHVGSRRPLQLQAVAVHPPGATGTDDLRWDALAFQVVVSTVPDDPPVVLVLRRAAGAFSERRAPVGFAVSSEPGFLVARTDGAEAAVNLLEQALHNHGLRFSDFYWSTES